MKITIDRPDLCTKKQVIKMMKNNYLSQTTEKNIWWNETINQLIEVIERDL